MGTDPHSGPGPNGDADRHASSPPTGPTLSLFGDLEHLNDPTNRAVLRTRFARRVGLRAMSAAAAVEHWNDATGWVATQLEFHHANPKWNAAVTTTGAVHDLDPGDVAALRFTFIAGPSVFTTNLIRRLRAGEDVVDQVVGYASAAFSQVALLADAVPFYLPATAATALLGSHPPDPTLTDHVRLPYPTTLVFFGAPLRIEPTSWFLHTLFDLDAAAQARDVLEQQGRNMEAITATSRERVEVGELFTDHGGWLYGVVLTATPDGRPDEPVLWLISAALPDGGEQMCLFHGARTGSALTPLAENITAAVAWASWTSPPPGEEFTGTAAEAAKRARTGSFKRRATRGAPFGVRVLDLAATTARAARSTPSTGRATPAPHLRRGHWRRARCGPRDDWHYEGRWISPTLVAGDLETATSSPERVYRLPDPPNEPPPELIEAWEHDPH